jgi:hypothetical protein
MLNEKSHVHAFAGVVRVLMSIVLRNGRNVIIKFHREAVGEAGKNRRLPCGEKGSAVRHN